MTKHTAPFNKLKIWVLSVKIIKIQWPPKTSKYTNYHSWHSRHQDLLIANNITTQGKVEDYLGMLVMHIEGNDKWEALIYYWQTLKATIPATDTLTWMARMSWVCEVHLGLNQHPLRGQRCGALAVCVYWSLKRHCSKGRNFIFIFSCLQDMMYWT